MKDTKLSATEQDSHQAKENNSDKADPHNHPEKGTDIKKQPNLLQTSVQPEPNSTDEITKLENQIAEYYDQLMRSRAELENFKKRTKREMTQIRNYANEQFAVELLAIKDSLEMGLQVDIKEDAQKLHEGIELTLKLLQQTFEKFGIKEINPKGEIFNPEHHQAMMTQTDATKPSNTILNVLQKGYSMNDRLLRPAMVCVSSQPEVSTPPKNPTAEKQSGKTVETTIKNTKGDSKTNL